ncbi:hypothetical protein [Chitinophaga pinensis]|uniref:Uncharacterized protein n=1 Tax=Chitinophaga pinensis (strain ATCC 43595 / DSM 2588 / LMG 13176 / NBRC 15968 / NCIMB 11800 / UQM 2034) TaxID=485918 RepID=A0A979G4K8_CHIPD|nr:hypothetical protein [Chitinophaga pinensis]ACU60699.1 hypothetical protein Cpin_3232 [Chitinophaga pinensis DSM 2588]
MELTSAALQSHAGDKRLRHRRRGKGQPVKDRSARDSRHQYLNQRLAPIITDKRLLKVRERLTTQFFTSLRYLADTYKFQPLVPDDYPFPNNILMALKQAQGWIQYNEPETTLTLEDTGSSYCIRAESTVDCSHTLLFIPFKPLYDLLKKGERQSAELLMSVYHYLLRYAGIPSYREEDSYVYDQYGWLMDTLLDGVEYEHYRMTLEELKAAYYWGDVIGRKLRNGIHCTQWPQRLAGYHPTTEAERLLQAIAENAYTLYTQYPRGSFSEYLSEEPEEDDDYAPLATPYNYLSFVWSLEGELYRMLEQAINNDFCEYGGSLVPYRKQVFDQPQDSVKTGLPFARLLDDLIRQLIDLEILPL